jgi:hypothetical protein
MDWVGHRHTSGLEVGSVEVGSVEVGSVEVGSLDTAVVRSTTGVLPSMGVVTPERG